MMNSVSSFCSGVNFWLFSQLIVASDMARLSSALIVSALCVPVRSAMPDDLMW